MRWLLRVSLAFVLCLWAWDAPAPDFKMSDGSVITGELVAPNDDGTVIRRSSGGLTSRLGWDKFAQDTLKTLAQDAKLKELVAFRAEALDFEAGVLRRARGELTLAGRTQPVTLSVERFGCTRLPFLVRTTCGADVATVIRRSAFGLTAWSGFVGDEVRLEIQVEAIREEAAAEPPVPGG